MTFKSNSDIGYILKFCRKKAGLSQDEMAEMMNVDRTYISKVENGLFTVTYDFVKKWGKCTGMARIIALDIDDESDNVFKEFEVYRTFYASTKANFEMIQNQI